MTKNTMYIVKYSKGSLDDYQVHSKFVTSNHQLAQHYIYKFNDIIGKFQDHRYGYSDEENIKNHYNLLSIRNAFLEQIEFR